MFRIGLPSPFQYSSPEWKALRKQALVRALWRCELCGRGVHGKGRARVDHIITVKDAPARALDITNLRVLCVDCDAKRHAEKGARIVERQKIGLDGFPE